MSAVLYCCGCHSMLKKEEESLDEILLNARKQVRRSTVERGKRTLPAVKASVGSKEAPRPASAVNWTLASNVTRSLVRMAYSQPKIKAVSVNGAHVQPPPSPKSTPTPRKVVELPTTPKAQSNKTGIALLSHKSPSLTSLEPSPYLPPAPAAVMHTTRYTTPKAIFAALQTEDVQLISLKWLLKRASKKKALPRRQALPMDAKLSARRIAELHAGARGFQRIASATQVKASVLPIIAISQCASAGLH